MLSVVNDSALGRPASPKEREHPLPASDRLLDDATTLLAALRMGVAQVETVIPAAVLLPLLQAAGATMAQVTECTVFLVDMADYAAMNAAYMEFFRTAPPARATLSVTALPRPAARVEIKCSAVVPD